MSTLVKKSNGFPSLRSMMEDFWNGDKFFNTPFFTTEEFTQMLVEAGIDSIAFNPDALINGINNINDVLKNKRQTEIQNELIGLKSLVM